MEYDDIDLGFPDEQLEYNPARDRLRAAQELADEFGTDVEEWLV